MQEERQREREHRGISMKYVSKFLNSAKQKEAELAKGAYKHLVNYTDSLEEKARRVMAAANTPLPSGDVTGESVESTPPPMPPKPRTYTAGRKKLRRRTRRLRLSKKLRKGSK